MLPKSPAGKMPTLLRNADFEARKHEALQRCVPRLICQMNEAMCSWYWTRLTCSPLICS